MSSVMGPNGEPAARLTLEHNLGGYFLRTAYAYVRLTHAEHEALRLMFGLAEAVCPLEPAAP